MIAEFGMVFSGGGERSGIFEKAIGGAFRPSPVVRGTWVYRALAKAVTAICACGATILDAVRYRFAAGDRFILDAVGDTVFSETGSHRQPLYNPTGPLQGSRKRTSLKFQGPGVPKFSGGCNRKRFHPAINRQAISEDFSSSDTPTPTSPAV
jgi:hypothetical protein